MSVCKKCGADVPPGVRFCSGCGEPVSAVSEPARIVLKCRDCNGVLTMDKEGEMLTCPYCGSKELIRNSDTVAVEKIRQQTEFKKWEREDLKEEQQKKEAQERSYKFGAFGVISIICAVLFGLMAAVQFTHIQNGWSVFAGLIAVSGVLVFSASVILRRGIVKIDKGYLATVLMIGGFLLLIPYFMVSSAAGIASSQAERVREEKEFKWPNSALAQLLPTPKSHFGKVTRDSADCLTVNVAKTTQADFDEYVEQCREKGLQYSVLKNRLFKLGLQEAGIEGVDDLLNGPNAFVFSKEDPVSGPKIISDYIEKNKLQSLKVIGGVFEGKAADVKTMQQLAKMPNRDELLATLVGCLQSPISGLVAVLDQSAEKKEAA